ncbi:MAG: ATP:cob(I)alamin adenosyltransferase [Hyphomicrobiales bacterium]|nr:MAG: ATP:cob(I)alamin adenosyltransferase [Hyphomicrobiales bacterium]
MVKLNKIYTRTGDDGSTGLGSGARVKKHDLRVEAYGAVDEANAFIGAARLHVGDGFDPVLARIQNDLFDLGADLCVPEEDEQAGALRVDPAQVAWLEAETDRLNADLAPLTSFILPGGSPAAAALHVARTVVRRAERQICRLADLPGERVNPAAIHYMNRLSDLLFVMSRSANGRGADDVLWVPGGNR